MTTAATEQPDVGVGFELIDAATARAERRAEFKYCDEKSGTWSINWRPSSVCLWHRSDRYVFRRPAA